MTFLFDFIFVEALIAMAAIRVLYRASAPELNGKQGREMRERVNPKNVTRRMYEQNPAIKKRYLVAVSMMIAGLNLSWLLSPDTGTSRSVSYMLLFVGAAIQVAGIIVGRKPLMCMRAAVEKEIARLHLEEPADA